MQQDNQTVRHENSYELPLNRLRPGLLIKGVFLLHDKDESWMILQNIATTPTFNYSTVKGTNTFITDRTWTHTVQGKPVHPCFLA